MKSKIDLQGRLEEYQRIETLIQKKMVENRISPKDRDMERILCLATLECMDKIHTLQIRIKRSVNIKSKSDPVSLVNGNRILTQTDNLIKLASNSRPDANQSKENL